MAGGSSLRGSSPRRKPEALASNGIVDHLCAIFCDNVDDADNWVSSLGPASWSSRAYLLDVGGGALTAGEDASWGAGTRLACREHQHSAHNDPRAPHPRVPSSP